MMRAPSATVDLFEKQDSDQGTTYVSGFSVHIVGDPLPTLVRYGSDVQGALFIETYDHAAQGWKPYSPNFNAEALRSQFGDTVLAGALKEDILFDLQISNEDAVIEGLNLITHSRWTASDLEDGRFWTYNSISMGGRNAPIVFRHAKHQNGVGQEVQTHDYRTGRWEPFDIVREYYRFEAFQSEAAAIGYLTELMPHLCAATNDLPDSRLRHIGAGIAKPVGTTPTVKPHGLSSAVPSNALYRRCVRVIAMVHELHKAGYQRLRMLPMFAPSGCHWRAVLTYADNVAQDGYSILREEEGLVVRYTSGHDNQYFGWTDAKDASARELARLFLQRFPDICRKSEGLDWAYAGWLTDVLGYAELGGEAGGLVHLIQDWDSEPSYMARWTPPPPTR